MRCLSLSGALIRNWSVAVSKQIAGFGANLFSDTTALKQMHMEAVATKHVRKDAGVAKTSVNFHSDLANAVQLLQIALE